ncbi:hypothetical protein KCH_73720 [Kitasatospora cheerisanensis KCTC 2395]|uniref:Uncharacterized protein n=1 Tax=Kitasatospora cheerisanensis KCTC 2395 TaxID=1348663 RepID=A0A066YI91_9ACTN|nr:hypothetical protein KCH_73720 [Kitasatospora cheerisanensis KCTC 2395]
MGADRVAQGGIHDDEHRTAGWNGRSPGSALVCDVRGPGTCRSVPGRESRAGSWFGPLSDH